MNPLVSVIIPVYNDASRLRVCLGCLQAQRYSPFETIVVDNGSEDLAAVAAAVAECPAARLVCEAMPGSYAARNRGIAVARGEVLAFTDADCVPSANWIEAGVAALRSQPNCGLAAGAIEIVMHNPQHPVELFESVMALSQQKFVTQDHYGATANVFTWAAVFEQVGQFNSALKSSGDVEWGQRVFAAGYAQIYAEQAKIQHPARASFADLARQTSRHAGGFYDLRCRQAESVGASNAAFCKLVGFHLIPPVRFAFKIAGHPDLKGVGEKVKVVAMLVFVRWVTVRTLIGLRVGGVSERV